MRGRRQIGKVTAVEHFVESCTPPYVFVTAVIQAPVTKQLSDATTAINESRRPLPDAALLTQTPATSWREWLGRLAIAARSGPVIAVLDEFPWLATGDATLEGELQLQWDRTLSKLPVLLVLIGSDVTMMDRLAHYDRPLFGRLAPLVVPALNPGEIAEAMPGRSAVEIFDAYLVTGGYPRLVTDLARHESWTTEDYVKASFADLYSPLVTTARLSLDAEFPEPQFAYQVLSAIGSSDTAKPGFNDIIGTIADPAERKRAETAITRALRTLTDTKALIEREQPAWAPATSKLRRYRLTDPYLRFWFPTSSGTSNASHVVGPTWRWRRSNGTGRRGADRASNPSCAMPCVASPRPIRTSTGSSPSYPGGCVTTASRSTSSLPLLGPPRWLVPSSGGSGVV